MAIFLAESCLHNEKPDHYAAAICIRVRPDSLLRGYSLNESWPPLDVAKAKQTSTLSECHEVFVERLLLFLLGGLLCLLRLLRFLGHAALRDPQSWLDASRYSTCKHSDYTTISKLIFRASNKVNERHIFAPTAKALTLPALRQEVVDALLAANHRNFRPTS
jgi:hypothetical protein